VDNDYVLCCRGILSDNGDGYNYNMKMGSVVQNFAGILTALY